MVSYTMVKNSSKKRLVEDIACVKYFQTKLTGLITHQANTMVYLPW